MNPQELYERQYGERKLITKLSFAFLRKIFKSFDVSREDAALELLRPHLEGEKKRGFWI